MRGDPIVYDGICREHLPLETLKANVDHDICAWYTAATTLPSKRSLALCDRESDFLGLKIHAAQFRSNHSAAITSENFAAGSHDKFLGRVQTLECQGLRFKLMGRFSVSETPEDAKRWRKFLNSVAGKGTDPYLLDPEDNWEEVVLYAASSREEDRAKSDIHAWWRGVSEEKMALQHSGSKVLLKQGINCDDQT